MRERGYCLLPGCLPLALIERCREGFKPWFSAYLEAHADQPNRGPNRHYLPMPFAPPCWSPEYFFNPDVLAIVHGAMDDRVVIDQWGCDVPMPGSEYQALHVDFKRPLFAEAPGLALPPYILVASFGLVPVTLENGPIEIAGEPVPMALGDVLIRHPWTPHRGTPNPTHLPRPLASIRYVRRWYCDDSREVSEIPRSTWDSLSSDQQRKMRFPVAG